MGTISFINEKYRTSFNEFNFEIKFGDIPWM